MYRDLKNYSSDSTEYITLKLNLGTYNYILRRNIYLAKKSYYANLFQKYKSDVKQTWSAISDVVNRKHKSHLTSELQIINLWLKSNKLSLNCKKSKFIVFYKPPRKTVIPELLIDNEKICCVDEFTFLGLTITKHLSWKKHLDKISNKISKMIGVLNKLKFIIPDQILLTIYNSLMLPHLNYCILAWGYDSKRLYKLQKKALRIINKGPYLAHTDPMFIKYNVLKVKDILEQNHLKFLFKLSHRSLPVYFYHFVSATGFDVCSDIICI